MKRRLTMAAAVAAALALGACGSEPHGPGTFAGTVTVTAPATLGAVVLELTGSGITGFESQGGSVAYGAVVNRPDGRWRVVVVGTGPLRFGVKMADVKGGKPGVQVVQAVDENNAPLPASLVKVTLD
jgi:hypothetical protein